MAAWKKFLAIGLALTLVLCSAFAFAAPVKIGVVQVVTHDALDAARDGFIAALKDNGYVDGDTISLDLQNAQGDQANMSTIADRFVANNVDLVLAVGTPVAEAVAGKTTTIPILGTAVTDYEVARLVDSNEVPGGNLSGTSDMNPVAAQIDLLRQLVPDAKTVGVIYNSSEDNSVLQVRLAKEAVEAAGLKFVEVTVTNSNDVQQAITDLTGRCDAIYIPTDNVVASAMPIVYAATVESKTPTICGEESMVNNGGLATLGINYFDLGYQTGEMAVRILKDGADISTMPIEFSKGFSFAINGEVAAEIGLEIPADLQQYVK